MYLSNNNDLKIAVIPRFQQEESFNHDFCWEYSVLIENNSMSNIQLISKYCQIIYADGSTHEIIGLAENEAAIIIEPGTILESKNTAIIKSNSAIVKGHYVVFSKGKEFDVEIPSFSLDNPYRMMTIN